MAGHSPGRSIMRLSAASIGWLSFGMAFCAATAQGGNWSQFRGENAAGLASESAKLPLEIGPGAGIVWKIPLSPGHASPVVYGARIFCNAVRDGKLLVV